MPSPGCCPPGTGSACPRGTSCPGFSVLLPWSIRCWPVSLGEGTTLHHLVCPPPRHQLSPERSEGTEPLPSTCWPRFFGFSPGYGWFSGLLTGEHEPHGLRDVLRAPCAAGIRFIPLRWGPRSGASRDSAPPPGASTTWHPLPREDHRGGRASSGQPLNCWAGELPGEGDYGFADCSLAQARELTQLGSALAPEGADSAPRGQVAPPRGQLLCPLLGFLSLGNTQDACQNKGRAPGLLVPFPALS